MVAGPPVPRVQSYWSLAVAVVRLALLQFL
jgi:hypothetical protein